MEKLLLEKARKAFEKFSDGKLIMAVFYNDWIDEAERSTTMYKGMCHGIDMVLKDFKPKKKRFKEHVNKGPVIRFQEVLDRAKKVKANKEGEQVLRYSYYDVIFKGEAMSIRIRTPQKYNYTSWTMEGLKIDTAFRLVEALGDLNDMQGHAPEVRIGTRELALNISDHGDPFFFISDFKNRYEVMRKYLEDCGLLKKEEPEKKKESEGFFSRLKKSLFK